MDDNPCAFKRVPLLHFWQTVIFNTLPVCSVILHRLVQTCVKSHKEILSKVSQRLEQSRTSTLHLPAIVFPNTPSHAHSALEEILLDKVVFRLSRVSVSIGSGAVDQIVWPYIISWRPSVTLLKFTRTRFSRNTEAEKFIGIGLFWPCPFTVILWAIKRHARLRLRVAVIFVGLRDTVDAL